MFKKSKLTAMLLTVSMLLTLFPFAAFATTAETAPAEPGATVATELPQADQGVITLTQDVELSTTKEFTTDVKLNLNNHNITAKDVRALWVKSGTLTIEGTGTITSVKPADGKLADSSSVIRVGDNGTNAAKLVLGEGVKVEAPVTYGVTVFGKNTSLEVVINGTIHSVNVPALSGNGSSSLAATAITLGNTAKVTADNAIAIYHPQAGTLDINGATVIGTGGIEIKSGTVNVAAGSTIKATATATAHKANGSGTSTDGYAIAVVDTNGGYPGKAQVNVSGGTVTGPVEKLVDKAPTEDKKASIAVSGGTFDKDVSEFLAADKGQNPDGTVGALDASNAAAKIGNQLYSSLSAAIAAAKDGEVIEVLKNVTVPSAQYVITKNITLKSANNPKIDVTVAPGVATKAFSVQAGAGLTLDGVTMTINGTKNANGTNDGTGMDIYNSTKTEVKGASLTLKNGAVLTLTNLERATIASSTPHNVKVVNQSNVTLEPGTTMNITNIDGNGANGGNWTVDGAALNVDGCGSYGVSAQTVTAKNNATVAVKNVGISGVTAKDIAIEKGSQVNVTQSGTKLPFKDWKGNQVNDVVALKDQGSLTLDKDSALTLSDNVGLNNKPVNTFGPGNGTVDMAGQFVGEVNAPAPDAQKNEVRITYTVNGNVYNTLVATKSAEGTVTFAEPAAPSVAGYNFNGWNYGDATVKVENGNVTLTPAAEKSEYTFTANLSAIVVQQPSHQVTVPTVQNGAVAVNPQNATAGQTVTITATPDKGFVVDDVTVTDKDGKAVTVTKNADGTYSFTMPQGAVTVNATFKAEGAAPSDMPFTDVAPTAWYYPAVEYAYNNGLMNGTTATTFAPNVNLSRAMMAAVLYNMEGGPACDKSGLFSDVADGKWYTEAVNWAASNKIVSGMPDGTFAPDQSLTREQMASILYRYAQFKGIDVSVRADLSVYTDGATVSPWAQEVVQWAVGAKLMNGTTDGALQPKAETTRAQVATVLMNFCEKVAK